MLVGEDGMIQETGDREFLLQRYPEVLKIDFGDGLIFPGFVDAHLPMTRFGLLGSFPESLEDWRLNYSYPEERRFSEVATAQSTARDLTRFLVKNGTTTVGLFGSIYWAATEAMFQAAFDEGIRAVIGKVSMDRHVPEGLTQPFKADYLESKALIEAWHGRDNRLFYALSPRSPEHCSIDLLQALGSLKRRYKKLRVQSKIGIEQDDPPAIKTLQRTNVL